MHMVSGQCLLVSFICLTNNHGASTVPDTVLDAECRTVWGGGGVDKKT